MKQYYCFDFSSYKTSIEIAKRKSLHWTGHLTGDVAMEMAKNIHNLLEAPGMGIMQQIGGRAPDEGTGKPKPRPKGKAKVFNPKNFAESHGDKVKEYQNMAKDWSG